MTDEYLSLDAAAALSGLHPNTLRRLLRAGLIRGRKTVEAGKARWRIRAESLRQYLEPGQLFALERREPPPRLRGDSE